MRKSVWIPLAVLIALAAVAFVALPRLADVDRYRDTIRIRASERLGREVTLGDLELSWFPVFGVRVNDVAIAALPQEGEGAIVEAARIRIGARLGPLLRRRLEVTSIVIEEPELSLIRDEDGVWNLLATVEQDSQRDSENGADVSFERVSIRNGRLHLVDRKDREEPLRLSLEDIDLDLAAWTPGRPLVFEADFLADGADGADGGRAEIRGRLGPWTEDARPVDLAVAAPALPLDALRPLFDRDSRLSLREGSIGIDVKIHGDALARLALDGTLRMHEGRVAVRRPDGSTANVAFGMQVNFDVAVEDLGSRVDLRLAEIAIGAHRLAFEGTWSGAKDARTVDLRLLPARLPADDLAALLASAVGELPIAVSSNTPLELRGRIHGALGGGATPAIEATATLADVRIRHEAMGAPLENVRAVVALDGEVLRVNDFSGTVGGTDVAGSFELVGFEAPKIRFDLASARADFAELFSLLGSSGARTEAADDPDSVPPGRAAPALPELDIDGTLQVERGTFGTLGFDAMRSDMTWRNGVVRLSRLTTGLYGGSFDGLAEADLSSVVPAWRLA
ncbi:MAG: AsmA family protein, partial [Planctomycetota bacterium]|nr:AsmA family protein [Planctomycetota bacterium]